MKAQIFELRRKIILNYILHGEEGERWGQILYNFVQILYREKQINLPIPYVVSIPWLFVVFYVAYDYTKGFSKIFPIWENQGIKLLMYYTDAISTDLVFGSFRGVINQIT